MHTCFEVSKVHIQMESVQICAQPNLISRSLASLQRVSVSVSLIRCIRGRLSKLSVPSIHRRATVWNRIRRQLSTLVATKSGGAQPQSE